MLKTVLFGDGLEAIGRECFRDSGLETITIPKGVRRIGDEAFFRCVSLRQISFAGEALESIGSGVFVGSGLESFTAPPSLRKIGENAF